MSEHIKEMDGEYRLSPAATLVLIADAIHSQDASHAGKTRAKRVIDEVMATARASKFKQADILETMLSNRTEPARLLPIFEDVVKHLNGWVVAEIVQRALLDAPKGGAQ